MHYTNKEYLYFSQYVILFRLLMDPNYNLFTTTVPHCIIFILFSFLVYFSELLNFIDFIKIFMIMYDFKL